MTHAKMFLAHVHTHKIAKPREMSNLSSVGKVKGLRRVWVWRPQLRLKPATQKKRGSFEITPSTVVRMIDAFL